MTKDFIAGLDCVARVSEWKDRSYLTLTGVSRSSKADTTTKIWVKGTVLTIETGKGYHSDEFIASKSALVDSAIGAGYRVLGA